MRILIVGAGIAGPTLAYWLHRSGHDVTIIERAPRLRRGGYLIDFWGAGYDVAERMGILPQLAEHGYPLRELRETAADGRTIASVDPRQITRLVDGRLITVARADLSATVHAAVQDDVETIFDETLQELHDDGRRVQVTFASGRTAEYDLVIGADGLHSQVRRTVFGPDADYERSLGIAVAAFDLTGYRPRDELVATTHTEVGFQVLRIPLHDDATMFLVTFRHDGDVPEDYPAAQQELVRSSLAAAGGDIPDVLARMPSSRTFYCDRASQIRMPTWSRGRVALIGDAAACPSLLAGQGSALAMVEAYELAASLHRAGDDHRTAFTDQERRLAPLVRSKQQSAIGLGSAFAPRHRGQLLLRNTVLRMMTVPAIARLAMRRSLDDPIGLSPEPSD